MTSPTSGFALLCPACRGLLGPLAETRLRCLRDGTAIRRVDGVWRFLTPPRDDERRFVEDYHQLRRDEGWGSKDPAHYRALPFRDTTERHAEVWRIRAASYELLVRRLPGPGCRIADLGAGNCWLSWRLTEAGHTCAALDLSDDEVDGLGAADRYAGADDFLRIQASYDRAPLADASVDLVIFNGSLHYSTDLLRTLTEARRLLRAGGRVVIMDSPLYRMELSGERMLEERREEWQQRYGPGFGGHPGVAFLTRRRLRRLGEALGLRWTFCPLPLGWRWRLSPFVSVGLGRREPARFPLIFGCPIAGTQGGTTS